MKPTLSNPDWGEVLRELHHAVPLLGLLGLSCPIEGTTPVTGCSEVYPACPNGQRSIRTAPSEIQYIPLGYFSFARHDLGESTWPRSLPCLYTCRVEPPSGYNAIQCDRQNRIIFYRKQLILAMNMAPRVQTSAMRKKFIQNETPGASIIYRSTDGTKNRPSSLVAQDIRPTSRPVFEGLIELLQQRPFRLQITGTLQRWLRRRPSRLRRLQHHLRLRRKNTVSDDAIHVP